MFAESVTSLPRAPTLGELARQRLRGWTKDAFRLSGITQVLLCTTSPTSSLRSKPPPLVGEALAFRDVFQQTQISFIENDTSLPRAPLPGELARQRLRGWTKDAFRVSGITQVLLCTTSPTSSLRSMPLSPFGTCVPPPPAGGVFPSRGGFGIP